MSEPVISCPNCQTKIKLTESLSAPIVDEARRQYEQKLKEKDQEVVVRLAAVKQEKEELEKSRASISEQVDSIVAREKEKLCIEEHRKARLALSGEFDEKEKEIGALQLVLYQRNEKLAEAQKAQVELIRKERELDDVRREVDLTIETRVQNSLKLINEQKAKEIGDLQSILQEKDGKLADAQRTQADLLKKQRELDDAKRELDVTVEKRVQDSLELVRDKVKKDVQDELKFKVLEKEKVISSMQQQIDELKRRSEQGSQQLQGEVQEIELEEQLRGRFAHDSVEPVPKGEFGGDIIHKIISPRGLACGAILWESKRTKHWSDGWLSKLREDQRAAKANIAIIISQVLPKGTETFEFTDGVWVAHPKYVIPLAIALRYALIELAESKQTSEGQQTKTEMVYQYLTGPQFRHRVEALVEKFTDMRSDLDKERKAMTRAWAKREEQITCVMDSIAGMYGDMQGIAGKSLKEIEGLEWEAEDKETNEIRMLGTG